LSEAGGKIFKKEKEKHGLFYNGKLQRMHGVCTHLPDKRNIGRKRGTPSNRGADLHRLRCLWKSVPGRGGSGF